MAGSTGTPVSGQRSAVDPTQVRARPGQHQARDPRITTEDRRR